ncbi:MAG: hypothetical protein HPY57_13920 [Ignavibacteria bacterium]|nr:hypothetical protein [Ignavibacteria bacterium]
MSQKTFIGLSPNFNGIQSGQTIVYSSGKWTGATIYTATEIDNNFLSANTFDTTINTNGINNVGNITATTFYGDLDWSYITNTPTTSSGYGITDVYTIEQSNNNFLSANTSFYTQSEADTKFVYKTGDTMTGELIINKTGQQALTVSGNVNMTGNLYVSGTTTYVNTEQLNVKDNMITINSGETGSGVTMLFSGIEVDRGALDNYIFVFDEMQDNFRIGESANPTGGTQAVATREDIPISYGIAFWNASLYRLDTTTNLVYSGSTLWLSDNANITGNVTGNTFYGTFVGTVSTTNLSLSNLTATTSWLTTSNITNATATTFNSTNGTITNLSATTINYNGQTIDDVFVNTNGDTMTGTLTVPKLTATTVSAITFHGNLDWVYIQNKPTTLAGYGIYDAYTTGQSNANFLSANTSFYTQAAADAKFVFKTGDTMTGTLTVPTLTATTVSATTLEGNLDWSYIQNEPNFDGLYYSISGGTIYGNVVPNDADYSLGNASNTWKRIYVSTIFYQDKSFLSFNPTTSATTSYADFLPNITNTWDLGASDKQWVNLWVSANTYIGGIPFVNNGNEIMVKKLLLSTNYRCISKFFFSLVFLNPIAAMRVS